MSVQVEARPLAARMGAFERHLSLWVLACMVVGTAQLPGNPLPDGWSASWDSLPVSLPVSLTRTYFEQHRQQHPVQI